MKVRCLWLILLVASSLCASSFAQPPSPQEREEWESFKAVASGNLDFSNALYKVLSRQRGNLFFSPASIHVILSMTSLGARGSTAQQMLQTLHLPSQQEQVKAGFRHLANSLRSLHDGPTLRMANRIYTDSRFSVSPNFLRAAREDFMGSSEAANFQGRPDQAREEINSWVENYTNRKISNLLPPGSIHASTMMVLVNALYFKGAWYDQFSTRSTSPKPFYVSPGVTKDVPMMHNFIHDFSEYKDSETLNAEILELPYYRSDISMVIILPKQRDGLRDVEARLARVKMSEFLMYETSSPQVHLSLPKFRLEQSADLVEVLTEMGMTDLFTSSANLTGLVEGAHLQVSRVAHKAFIEVDENGTEAAAATAAVAVPVSAPIEPPRTITFKVDHPFLFALVKKEYNYAMMSNQKTILFMGRYEEPN